MTKEEYNKIQEKESNQNFQDIAGRKFKIDYSKHYRKHRESSFLKKKKPIPFLKSN